MKQVKTIVNYVNNSFAKTVTIALSASLFLIVTFTPTQVLAIEVNDINGANCDMLQGEVDKILSDMKKNGQSAEETNYVKYIKKLIDERKSCVQKIAENIKNDKFLSSDSKIKLMKKTSDVLQELDNIANSIKPNSTLKELKEVGTKLFKEYKFYIEKLPSLHKDLSLERFDNIINKLDNYIVKLEQKIENMDKTSGEYVKNYEMLQSIKLAVKNTKTNIEKNKSNLKDMSSLKSFWKNTINDLKTIRDGLSTLAK